MNHDASPQILITVVRIHQVGALHPWESNNYSGYKNRKTARDSSGFRVAVIKTTRVGRVDRNEPPKNFWEKNSKQKFKEIQRIYMFLELLKPKTKVGQNDSVFQFRVFCISAYLLVPHELFQPSIRAIAWLLVSAEYCSRSQFLCRRKLLFSRDAQGNPLLENQ